MIYREKKRMKFALFPSTVQARKLTRRQKLNYSTVYERLSISKRYMLQGNDLIYSFYKKTSGTMKYILYCIMIWFESYGLGWQIGHDINESCLSLQMGYFFLLWNGIIVVSMQIYICGVYSCINIFLIRKKNWDNMYYFFFYQFTI